MDVPAAANTLGILGAVCWSVQLIPQIVVNYRRHHAVGLQPSMMMLWAWAGVPLGVYNIVKEFNIALRIQPQILTFLSLTTWVQCYYYQKKWSVMKCLCVVAPIVTTMGGVEAALIIGLRISISRHVEWPMTLMAVLSAALLAAGVLRHYWDIWVHRTVRGISFIFVGIDAAGDLFSLLSLLFQPTLDILGMAIYGTELVLWLGVFACGGYYNFLPWVRQKWSTNESRRSQSFGLDREYSDQIGSATVPVALHDIPSSTSVFRTVSTEPAALRPRILASTRSSSDG
ncbi:PQ loop repeat-domain-containing protein [Xylariaceae sp. FL1651]|nr:PQ loop repeat-domain-containing protein [Xylariaceae sp. FL1651]